MILPGNPLVCRKAFSMVSTILAALLFFGQCLQKFKELERVPKNKLKETDICPICSYPFLDDKFPLVVQLPCHRDHVFDLDCIRPWLKLNTSCPLDRKDLQQNNESSEAQPPDEDEDDYDEMFA